MCGRGTLSLLHFLLGTPRDCHARSMAEISRGARGTQSPLPPVLGLCHHPRPPPRLGTLQAGPLLSPLPSPSQNLVMFLSVLVDWMIPDIPTDISEQIKREKSLFVDFFLKEEHEKLKLAEEPARRSQSSGHRSRRGPAASPAPSGRSQPGSSASLGSQHTSV